MEDAEGDSRLAGNLDLPAWVLNRYHRGLLRIATHEDSSARDDLISDGVVKLVELDSRFPKDMDPKEFRARAIGHLLLYYRGRYRKFLGLYRGKNKTDRKRVLPQRRNLDVVIDTLTTVNSDIEFFIAVDDFLEGYECIYPDDCDGTQSPRPSSSGGLLGLEPSVSKSRPAENSPAAWL